MQETGTTNQDTYLSEAIIGASLPGSLPAAERAADVEVLELIERRRLPGSGLGLIDMHLLASALLEELPLWTLDDLLRRTADELGLQP